MSVKKYLEESIKYILRCPLIIRPYIKEVERLYAMSPEELMERNEQRFLEIFRRAYDKSSFYHRLYVENGISKDDIKSLKDIKKLPVITKEMVKHHGLEMLTVPRWQVIKGNTSGTTGTPLSVYSNWSAIWRTQAYTYCSRKRDGFIYGQRLVSLRGHLNKKDLSLRVHVGNTLYLSSYNINSEHVRFYYESITKFHPVAIEGYPSSLYALALLFKESGLKLSIPVTFTSSETLLDYQRRRIEEQFGTQIYDRYSMTERTIYLLESYNHEGYYEAPGFSINEYIEDGEICTSLINDVFPLIRYRSNDVLEMAEISVDSPQIILQGIEGRKERGLLCKNGVFMPRLDVLFKGVKHVKYCHFKQAKDGFLQIGIVPEMDFVEADKIRLEQNLLEIVGKNNIDYRIELIAERNIQNFGQTKFSCQINLKVLNQCQVPKQIVGRVDDYIVCKDGSIVSRIDFIENGAHIKACQWVQNDPGTITILIVPDDEFSEDDRLFVIKETERKVGQGNLDIETLVVPIEKLIYSRRGKFKLIVNNIQHKVNG